MGWQGDVENGVIWRFPSGLSNLAPIMLYYSPFFFSILFQVKFYNTQYLTENFPFILWGKKGNRIDEGVWIKQVELKIKGDFKALKEGVW